MWLCLCMYVKDVEPHDFPRCCTSSESDSGIDSKVPVLASSIFRPASVGQVWAVKTSC